MHYENTYPPISDDSSLQETNFWGPASLKWQRFDCIEYKQKYKFLETPRKKAKIEGSSVRVEITMHVNKTIMVGFFLQRHSIITINNNKG